MANSTTLKPLPERVYVIGYIGRKKLLACPYTGRLEMFDSHTAAVKVRYAECADPGQFDVRERNLADLARRGVRWAQLNGCAIDPDELALFADPFLDDVAADPNFECIDPDREIRIARGANQALQPALRVAA